MAVNADIALTAADLARIAPLWRRELRCAEPVMAYAIQAGEGGPVKIGLAKKPAERLKTLQCGNHETLRGLAAWRVLALEERQLHEEFAYAHIRGEWFRPVPALLDLVEALGGEYEDWS
jgi:hypothetical protein